MVFRIKSQPPVLHRHIGDCTPSLVMLYLQLLGRYKTFHPSVLRAECSSPPSSNPVRSVWAPLGGSSFVSQNRAPKSLLFRSVLPTPLVFFPARGQVLEQCHCEYLHRAHGSTLTFPQMKAPETTTRTDPT